MQTIKEHYDHLRDHDMERYGAMNGKLSSKRVPSGDCLNYFKRSIVEKQARGGQIDLAVVPGWIQKQMVDYLGFTWQQIWANQIPALPMLEPAE